MSEPGEYGKKFVEWTESLPNDVQAIWDLMLNEKIAQPGRRYLASALSYILTQLDLIPDHEKAGAVDDVIVLRVACALAAEHSSDAPVEDTARLGRLANEEEPIRAFLGDGTFAKLRRYVTSLADKEVRGRSVERILADEHARQDMKRELDQSMKKVRATAGDDPAALEVSVKSYFKMKLG
jgi:uncharacterized membrane protein YkvA (DUF1232 family)